MNNKVPTFENFVNENESHDESLRKAFSIIKAFGPATVISDETIEVPGHRIEAFGPNNRKILADILNEVNPIIIGEYDEQNTHTVWIRDISDFDKMYELIVSKLSEISISKRPWNKNEIWIKGANTVFFTFNSNLTSISLSRDWALSYANELLKRIGASDDEVDSIGAIGTIFENEEQSSEEIVRILNTLGLKCELTSSGDYYRIHNRFWVLYWESTFDNDFLNSLVLNDQESNYIFKKAISHSFFSYSKESLVSLVDRFNRDLGTNMRFDKRTEELYWTIMSSNLIGGLVSHNSSILVRAQDLPGVLRITLNKLGIDKGSDEYLGLDASSILTEEKTGSDELGSSYSFDLLESQVKTFNEFNEWLAEQSDDIGRDIDLLKTFDVSVTHNTKNGEKFDIFNLVKLLFYKQRLNERELKELTDPNVPSLLRINGSAYLIYYIIPTELKHFNQTILNKVGFNLNSDSILRNNDFTEIVGEWLAFSYLTAMDGSKIRLMASRLRNQLGIDGSDMEDGIKDQAQLM